MSAPLISVIMPCYNAAPFVAEALGSALGQSHGNVEVIIADDGSSDGSVEIIQRLVEAAPNRIRLLHTPRLGPFPARNAALKLARGELVAFLDADDWWHSQALEMLLAGLVNQNADLAYCGWQNVGRLANTDPYIPPAYEVGDSVEAFLQTCPWPIHAALVRREVIEAVHGFSTRRFSAMDYDLWLRILAQTQKITLVPQVLAFYRWHNAGQISANRARQVSDATDVRRDFVAGHPELVAHLDETKIRKLIFGPMLSEAYTAFWKRDLVTAQKLFRKILRYGYYRSGDLKYIVPAFLPARMFGWLVHFVGCK